MKTIFESLKLNEIVLVEFGGICKSRTNSREKVLYTCTFLWSIAQKYWPPEEKRIRLVFLTS